MHSRATRRTAADEAAIRCQACACGLAADCLAITCCPFAVLHVLVLAVKLPCMVGRRCLRCSGAHRRRMKCRGRVDCCVPERGAALAAKAQSGAEAVAPMISAGNTDKDSVLALIKMVEAEKASLEMQLGEVCHMGFGIEPHS